MANLWNVVNLNLDDQSGMVQIGNGHPLLMYLNLLVTPPPPGGGQHTIDVHKLQLLALALCKRDPLLVPNPLDQIIVGDSKLDLVAIIRLLGIAFTAGFTINILPGPLHLNYVFALQGALSWSLQNTLVLGVLGANDWVGLPAIPAAQHNHYRFQFTAGMFTSGGMFHPLVEFLSFTGYFHTIISRGANSRFAEVVVQIENYVAGAVAMAPSMRSAMIAQTFVGFSLPLTWRYFPHPTNYPDADLVACLRQRFYVDDSSRANRRMSFTVSLPGILAPGRYTTLCRFLQPASSDNESVQAYESLVQQICPSVSEMAFFSEHTVIRLDSELTRLSDVADAADRAIPIHMALQRANAAILVFQQRLTAIQNTPLNPSTESSVNSLSRAQKTEVHNSLSILPWFGGFMLQVGQLYAANPANDLPLVNAALNTRNMAIYQVITGKVKGLSDLHATWRILETTASKFINFVSYCVCMLPTGARPPYTLAYHFVPTHLTTFLSGNREKFLTLPIVDICIGIKKARDQLADFAVNTSDSLFDTPDIFDVLRMFQFFLDIFRFKASGVGSWDEALNRIAAFRTTGTCLPAEGRKYHMVNVQQLYVSLLNDLFDNVLPFSGPLDGALVTAPLSDRVYEAGGTFDRQMNFQTTQTATLNGLLNLNPAFAGAMGKSSSNGSSLSGVGNGLSTSPGGKFEKGNQKSKIANGAVLFGNGTGGPKYMIKPIMGEVKKVEPGANRGNFCLEAYLSHTNKCSNGKHSQNHASHKFSAKLQAIRDELEFKPFRVDSKAKTK